MPGASTPPDSPAGRPQATVGAAYAERLHVPLRWWVQAIMFLATLWLAFIVATPGWIAWTVTAVVVAITFGLFWLVGAARIEVRSGELVAGSAHISVALLGPAQLLEAADTRRVAGVDADARAYLLMRPYLKRSVKVPVLDPADPTPYWLLSTRHPDELAAALAAVQ